jgi:predicted transcriptional regulator
VFVYVSGTGAVQGEFTCPGCIGTNLVQILEKQSCVSLEDLKRYAGGKSIYGWIVKSPKKYDRPKPLSEFYLSGPPVSWQYIDLLF